MTTFQDGPAHGQSLMLKRAPDFLRVAREGSRFDALDSINDTPKPEEQLYAYQLVGKPGVMHVRAPGGASGFYVIASYRYVPIQPADAVMRKLDTWLQWYRAQNDLSAPVDL